MKTKSKVACAVWNVGFDSDFFPVSSKFANLQRSCQ